MKYFEIILGKSEDTYPEPSGVDIDTGISIVGNQIMPFHCPLPGTSPAEWHPMPKFPCSQNRDFIMKIS